jgi:hypothetical protein
MDISLLFYSETTVLCDGDADSGCGIARL